MIFLEFNLPKQKEGLFSHLWLDKTSRFWYALEFQGWLSRIHQEMELLSRSWCRPRFLSFNIHQICIGLQWFLLWGSHHGNFGSSGEKRKEEKTKVMMERWEEKRGQNVILLFGSSKKEKTKTKLFALGIHPPPCLICLWKFGLQCVLKS